MRAYPWVNPPAHALPSRARAPVAIAANASDGGRRRRGSSAAMRVLLVCMLAAGCADPASGSGRADTRRPSRCASRRCSSAQSTRPGPRAAAREFVSAGHSCAADSPLYNGSAQMVPARPTFLSEVLDESSPSKRACVLRASPIRSATTLRWRSTVAARPTPFGARPERLHAGIDLVRRRQVNHTALPVRHDGGKTWAADRRRDCRDQCVWGSAAGPLYAAGASGFGDDPVAEEPPRRASARRPRAGRPCASDAAGSPPRPQAPSPGKAGRRAGPRRRYGGTATSRWLKIM
jgi:hypothetical protein